MVIWKGLGFLGVVLPALCYALMNLIVGDGDASKGITGVTAGLLAGVLVWVAARSLGRTGRRSQHQLFFIPLQYWAFIWPIVGALMARG